MSSKFPLNLQVQFNYLNTHFIEYKMSQKYENFLYGSVYAYCLGEMINGVPFNLKSIHCHQGILIPF